MQDNTEELDRNKTPLTHKITAGVETFLADKGFKPIETEVSVAECWVADVAGVIVPTYTELQKMKLVPSKPQYGSYTSNPDEREKRRKAYEVKYAAWKEKAQAIPQLLTAAIEVKTSRSDFLRDDKWSRPSPTNLRYLAIPAGMLKRDEFPVGWWVLEFGSEGKLIRVAQKGDLSLIEHEKQLWTVHNIAVRRHHRTENVWVRDMQRKFNARMTEEKQNARISNVVAAVMSVAEGGKRICAKSVEECFKYCGVKYDTIDDWTKKRLATLWNTKKEQD